LLLKGGTSKKRPSPHLHKVPTRCNKVSPQTLQTVLVYITLKITLHHLILNGSAANPASYRSDIGSLGPEGQDGCRLKLTTHTIHQIFCTRLRDFLTFH